jgi:hypothetical protein
MYMDASVSQSNSLVNTSAAAFRVGPVSETFSGCRLSRDGRSHPFAGWPAEKFHPRALKEPELIPFQQGRVCFGGNRVAVIARFYLGLALDKSDMEGARGQQRSPTRAS